MITTNQLSLNPYRLTLRRPIRAMTSYTNDIINYFFSSCFRVLTLIKVEVKLN